MVRKGIVPLILSVLLFCSGCRISYLFHAAEGQFRLLHNSISVEEALKKDSLSSSEKQRLAMVAEVKAFGETHLGLKETDNYRTVYLDSSQAPIYLVSAAPKDRLSLKTWWFPVVGSVPYLGFFEKQQAIEERDRLLAEDLDVMLGIARAYSTLGWFEDPLTLNLIEGATVDLVDTILHEMTHATLYVKGQGDFNEGLALLVGRVGAEMFFERAYGSDHPFTTEARHIIEDERIFSSFLKSVLEDLKDLYSSPLSYRKKLIKREKVFSRALREFEDLKGRLKTDRFSGFGRMGLDNAYLMSVGLYHRHFLLFEKMLEDNDNSVKNMLAYLESAAQEEADLITLLKKRHLDTPS